MKEKHLKIFAGVFGFLLILYFVTKPRHLSVNVDEFVQQVVIGISKEDIKNIEVYKETGSGEPVQMKFTFKNDQWWMPTKYGCKAQKSRIDRLLDAVLEMTGKVRSSDPKHLDNYKIGDAQGIHLLLKDETDKSLANLVIGKRSEESDAGFVRYADKDKVYAVDKNLLSTLGIYGEPDTLTMFKDDSFVDLQAVDQDKDKLELIGLVINGKEMVVKQIEKEVEVTNSDSTKSTKTEKIWVLQRGKKELELDKKEVDKFIRDVTKIRAQKVIDRIGNTLSDFNKSGRYGFSRPTHYIVFKKPDGPQENVLFGKAYEGDKGYYMHVQYDGLVYEVVKSNYDKIFKWMDDLPGKVKK
jgi:hypothetical protein